MRALRPTHDQSARQVLAHQRRPQRRQQVPPRRRRGSTLGVAWPRFVRSYPSLSTYPFQRLLFGNPRRGGRAAYTTCCLDPQPYGTRPARTSDLITPSQFTASDTACQACGTCVIRRTRTRETKSPERGGIRRHVRTRIHARLHAGAVGGADNFPSESSDKRLSSGTYNPRLICYFAVSCLDRARR